MVKQKDKISGVHDQDPLEVSLMIGNNIVMQKLC